ncbi:MAG TPA: hypothetical protein VHE13_06045 [Opitutus sp.]|nr:hypothetical protein [Opitutus sp.]
MKTRILSATVLPALLLLAGCAGAPGALFDPARNGPLFTPENYIGVARLPGDLRRVVLLPLAAADGVETEMAAAFDPVFVAALERANRFEVVALSRAECGRVLGAQQFLSTAALPDTFMTELREHYAADGVLFVDLTVARTLRPLTLGVRAKLATTGEDVRMIWTFDNVFSTGEPAVLNSARRYFLANDDSGLAIDRSEVVLQSPSRFAGYVAHATFGTLPPR